MFAVITSQIYDTVPVNEYLDGRGSDVLGDVLHR